jgi:hypothetical protein
MGKVCCGIDWRRWKSRWTLTGDSVHMQNGWSLVIGILHFSIASGTERKRSNRKGKLRKENGGLVEEEGEKRGLITNYFSELRSSGNQNTHGYWIMLRPKLHLK